MKNKNILIPIVTLSLLTSSTLIPIVYAEELDSDNFIEANEVIPSEEAFNYTGTGTLTYEDNIIYISGEIILNIDNQEINSNIELSEDASLVLNILNNGSFTGDIIEINNDNNITIKLDDTSNLNLTSDMYITILENSLEDNSNINFNEFKLYINGESLVEEVADEIIEEVEKTDDIEEVVIENTTNETTSTVDTTNSTKSNSYTTKTSDTAKKTPKVKSNKSSSSNDSTNKKNSKSKKRSNDSSNSSKKDKNSLNKDFKEKKDRNNEESDQEKREIKDKDNDKTNNSNIDTSKEEQSKRFFINIWESIKEFFSNLFNK